MVFENMQFSRFSMYREIENWIHIQPSLPSNSIGKTVGGCSPILNLFPEVKWEITNFFKYENIEDLIFRPNQSIDYILSQKKIDAHNLPWEDEKLDIIISDQMLEHVQRPWIVANELIRVLKKGGLLICTTCFMQRSHDKGTFFNFHPNGLNQLFGSSLENKFISGWGHRIANDLINYSNVRNAKVKNNEKLKEMCDYSDVNSPFSTWVCGKKK
jgi:SAM-dependent methyltransferase